MLIVPFAAMTAFADPQVKFGLRFQGPPDAPIAEEPKVETKPAVAGEVADVPRSTPQVVSLDAFRRRPVRD